jgi:four helix bundle protein
MNSNEMKSRTKDFAKRVINLCRRLPHGEEGLLIRNQLFRAGTSVRSNYRAACRGRSKADFISKLGIVLEEADESLYWMEIVVETNIMKERLLTPLMKEANELIAISVRSLRTAKAPKSSI